MTEAEQVHILETYYGFGETDAEKRKLPVEEFLSRIAPAYRAEYERGYRAGIKAWDETAAADGLSWAGIVEQIAERDEMLKRDWQWAEVCGRQAVEIARLLRKIETLLRKIETLENPPVLRWDAVERRRD